ncbi:MAG: FkbM family methyltransferase [Bacteroidales bacterium]|nr:FkbM family methyltransferase [Bacteroidales bacterium]
MKLKYRFRKAYRKFLFSLSASENPFYLGYCRYIYKPRPGTIEAFLDQYSRNHRPVTFLQVGANDGFINDPLHIFIKRDNWSGVLLEPQPGVFNEFMARLHSKRPGISAINAALDKTDGTRKLYKMAISGERWAHGLSSFNREVLVKKVEDGSMMRNIRRQGVTLPDDKDSYITFEEVATISPETLLKKFEGRTIDLLAIDTEGFDYEILKMLDLDRISPEVIIYEEVVFDEMTARECRGYLESHGYSCRSLKRDVLAVKSRSA